MLIALYLLKYNVAAVGPRLALSAQVRVSYSPNPNPNPTPTPTPTPNPNLVATPSAAVEFHSSW